MKIPNRKIAEAKCPACDGKGVAKVQQPTQPGRKIYGPTCKECLGKGQIENRP
jgi:DnaJ-class molecular chaperone